MTPPDPPPNVARLPRDRHDRPVPAFVTWIDGAPDFRVMRPDHVADCHRFSLCWICGRRRGRHATFVIGPMCAVNRISAEPPSHHDCAVYAALACPFLTVPRMTRRDRHLPDDTRELPGMIHRNPGVTLLWTTPNYQVVSGITGRRGKVPVSEALFRIGPPERVAWYCEGRPATRAEVADAVASGLPELEARCTKPQLRQLPADLEATAALLPAD